ncbi:MAG: LLM class flavin-dependent oxidoreductase [Pseudolysinimonas sp.]
MKFSAFHPFPAYGIEDKRWPSAPKYATPEIVRDSLAKDLDYARLVDRAGFDSISVAEHHYTAQHLAPNSVMVATIVHSVLEKATVNLLGSDLPLVNPVRLAEEISTLDALTGGNLLVGFFRGVPFEYMSYGTNPWESKEVFYEQIDLILRAWYEPEPFAWIGRHFDYRVVSLWPRATRTVPILLAAGSPASAIYAAERGALAGFPFLPAEAVRPMVDVYQSRAAELGRTVTPDDLLSRAFGLVADTDAEAWALAERYNYGDMNKLYEIEDFSVLATLGAAFAGAPKGFTPPPGASGPAFPTVPAFIGSPETVATQIRDFVAATGVGRIEVTLNASNLPFEHAARSTELFGTEVIPLARSLDSVAEEALVAIAAEGATRREMATA